MTIPLVRPMEPDLSLASYLLRHSQAKGVYTNFGPCEQAAVRVLESITSRHCVLTTNGTSAIDVALRSLKPFPSRKLKVLLPDYTHSGTLQAVVNSGNEPVLGPVKTFDWQLDLEHAAECLDFFDVMIVVAPFGMKVDTTRFEAFALLHGKQIVYDFAGAWGQFPRTRFPVCYSFHATKNFNAGEGGLVTYQQKEMKELARSLTNFCVQPDREVSSLWGYNFKVDEFKSALIWAQARNHEKIMERVERKKDTYLKYRDALDGIVDTVQVELFLTGSPSLCVFGGFGKKAKLIEQRGAEEGIVFRTYYPLLSKMKACEEVTKIWRSNAQYFDGCLALPSDVSITEFARVVKLVKQVCEDSASGDQE